MTTKPRNPATGRGREREESFSRGGIHLPRLNPFHPFSLLVFLLFGGLINQTLVDHASFRKVFEILDSHFPPTPRFGELIQPCNDSMGDRSIRRMLKIDSLLSLKFANGEQLLVDPFCKCRRGGGLICQLSS